MIARGRSLDAPASECAGKRASHWHDRADGYGWISITLHWATAVGVLALLFIGASLGSGGDPALRAHTTLALTLLPLFAGRIYWRLSRGHPQPSPKQGRWASRLGRWLHFALLGTIAAMFVTGPLAAWANGMPIRLFDFVVLEGTPTHSSDFVRSLPGLHALGAAIIAYGSLIHVAAVLKHVLFDKDGTFGRMMSPIAPGAPPYSAETGRSDSA